MFYCIVAGSRHFTDYALMENKLDKIFQNKNDVVIISGGATGADTLAELYAKEHELRLMVFPAKWSVYNKRAGYIRNKEMHKYISQYPERGCVCFWDGQSKGTAHNFNLAKEYDTPLRVIRF